MLESAKKGTLKIDLQALTVGTALLTMHRWLTQLRESLVLADAVLLGTADGPAAAAAAEVAAQLDANRKLAVINGMGEFNRAQGNSSAVKEAVAASLIAAKAPFRLVQDHSRSGRLEAATPALRKWLLSSAFGWCALMSPVHTHIKRHPPRQTSWPVSGCSLLPPTQHLLLPGTHILTQGAQLLSLSAPCIPQSF